MLWHKIFAVAVNILIRIIIVLIHDTKFVSKEQSPFEDDSKMLTIGNTGRMHKFVVSFLNIFYLLLAKIDLYLWISSIQTFLVILFLLHNRILRNQHLLYVMKYQLKPKKLANKFLKDNISKLRIYIYTHTVTMASLLERLSARIFLAPVKISTAQENWCYQ